MTRVMGSCHLINQDPTAPKAAPVGNEDDGESEDEEDYTANDPTAGPFTIGVRDPANIGDVSGHQGKNAGRCK